MTDKIKKFEDPAQWGPHFWYVMRCVANTYSEVPTEKEQKVVLDFFTLVKDILPCEKCKEHYKETIEKIPLDGAIASRADLVKWVEDIYKMIDDDLKKLKKLEEPEQSEQPNKKEFKKKKTKKRGLTPEQAKARYSNRGCKYCKSSFTI